MKNKLEVIRTAMDTADRMSKKEELYLSPVENPDQNIIEIDENKEYQLMEGFGGAFTEAAADTFYRMSEGKRKEILEAYFDPLKGLNYSLCRTHINSCDFSLGNYSYDEVVGDKELEHFSIDRDKKLLIPMIKEAIAVKGSEIKLLASPWSPPGWMKTNGEMNHGGKLKEEYRESWARYFAKYIKAYRNEGVNIWGISVQNEPDAVQTWDSCIYSHEEERDFVRDYLGPVLAETALENINVIVWDHNTDQVYERAKTILEDAECAKYVWGAGFHWYSGDQFGNLAKTHADFPDKKLLFTEGCQEGGVHLDSWAVGERYGHNMINDFNNWTVGWIDWNLVLNESGGPNHVGNYCDAPVIADTKTDEIYYENSYYYIGHFSKYIEPGAVRIGCSYDTCSKLEATAFKNPDGALIIVVMNANDYETDYTIKIGGEGTVITAPAHSIVTLRYLKS
ncbi:MAG TPA: glycoside hydrolase family 30 protein [Clostridia bacterium]|nr:glycoside hydrolase family 30 protein [Clostridia bacterium]